MQQVFNFQQLGNSLAGLFDGSNANRGRIDRARADYEEQRARQITMENEYKDPSKILDWSAMFESGGDPNKLTALKQYIHPELATIQAQTPSTQISQLDANQAALKQVSDAVSNTTQPAVTQDLMRSIYQLSDADKKSLGQTYKNYFANSAFGGNGRMMIQNMLDMNMQNRQFSEADKLASAYQAGSARDVNSVQATIAALSGKNYDPYAVNGDGLVYNKGTGQVDVSNPLAQANIVKIGKQTGLIGAQTQGEYLNQDKTRIEMEKINQAIRAGNLDYVQKLTGVVPELYYTEAVDKTTGVKTKVFDNARYLSDVQKSIQTGQPVQVVAAQASSNIQNERDLAIQQYTSPTFNAGQYLPNAAQQKEAELGALVAQGKLTAQQAEAQFNAFMKGGR